MIVGLDESIQNGTPKQTLQSLRDKALLLLGFWRAFRSDELVRMSVEHVNVVAGEGMEIFVPRSKGDHSQKGRRYKAPALQQLCPVDAYLDWINAALLTEGPVFRSINQWGHIADTAMHPASISGVLKRCCHQAGLSDGELFSSHSLRRGFANWANESGWDSKTLMEYVGWKDVQSAMRYIDGADPFLKHRVSRDLLKTDTSVMTKSR